MAESKSAASAPAPDDIGSVGLLSWITGAFLNPVIARTASQADKFGEADLLNDVKVQAEGCHAAFLAAWNQEVAKGKDKASLIRALRATFWKEAAVAALLKVAWGALTVLSAAFFVWELLLYLRKRRFEAYDFLGEGYILAAFFFVTVLLLGVCMQQMNALSSRLGLRVRAAVHTAVFAKLMVEDRTQNTVDVLSLVATDCAKLQEACSTLHFLWSGIAESVAIMAVLLGFVGTAALPGLGLLLLLVPVQYFIGIWISKTRKSVVAASDARVNLMDEILRAIKLVKMYAWQGRFAAAVAELRAHEVHLAKLGGYLKSVNLALVFSLPPLIALSIFGLYSRFGTLDAVLAFATLSLFNTLRLPLVQLPKGLRGMAEALAACKRLQEYLLAPERTARVKSATTEVVLREASFTWGAMTTPLLRAINLQLRAGQVCMIAGPTAGGKSNLISAILGQMTRLNGTESVGGRMAYVPQSPWCAYGTVRDNILFGCEYDEMKYRRVIHACALETDITMMPNGDLTELGEGGRNLSGGQRQRIALARACYRCLADTDKHGPHLVLLDSPLSAVDSYTAQHIMRFGILGIMKGALVVLVTHQVELFTHADIVCYMEGGTLQYAGPPDPVVIARYFPHYTLPDTDTEILQAAAAASATGAAPAPVPAAADGHGGGSGTGEAEADPARTPGEGNADSGSGSHSGSGASHAHGPSHSLPEHHPPPLSPPPRVHAGSRSASLGATTPTQPSSSSGSGGGGPDTIRRSNSNASHEGAAGMMSGPASASRRSTASEAGELALHVLEAGHAGADALNPAGRLLTRALSKRGELLRSTSTGGAGLSLPVIQEEGRKGTASAAAGGGAGAGLYGGGGGPNWQLELHPPDTAVAGRPRRPQPEEMKVRPYSSLVYELRWYLVAISLLVFGITQVTRIFSDTWLSTWVRRPFAGKEEDYYVSIYASYVALFIVLLLIRGLLFYAITRRGATRLHNDMFAAILGAPMSFFTTTPLGKVLSIFARDMDQIDEALMDNLHMVIIYFAILCTTMGVVIRVINVFAAIVAGMALAFLYFFRLYISASRSLKTVAGSASASVVSHVSESLQGIVVVQAYEAEGRFRADNLARLNSSQKANFNLEALQVWLSFRLDLIGSLLVLATCLLCVGLQDQLTPALAGLAISNSFQILLFFSLMVRGAADIDANMASVERVVRLKHAEQEREVPLNSDSCPAQTWPARGEIEFHNVVLSYSRASPQVLKGVSFTINAGEKIGIVGRTGAGKSSLVWALFRLTELTEGSIRIDNIDLSVLNLRELRKRIAIIPQEPTMFSGSIRSNLDPFEEHSDAELWLVLERCLLGPVVHGHPDGLAMPVAHMGANFSLGTQQLMCLARAMLNSSRVLVLDEATAALDGETDAKVQMVLRRHFADRTILTIAHRLDTIIDSDRILVMDAGRVAEFAAPYTLLQDPDSIFSQLCKQTGAQYGALRSAAKRHAEATLALAQAVAVADGDLDLSEQRREAGGLDMLPAVESDDEGEQEEQEDEGGEGGPDGPVAQGQVSVAL